MFDKCSLCGSDRESMNSTCIQMSDGEWIDGIFCCKQCYDFVEQERPNGIAWIADGYDRYVKSHYKTERPLASKDWGNQKNETEKEIKEEMKLYNVASKVCFFLAGIGFTIGLALVLKGLI